MSGRNGLFSRGKSRKGQYHIIKIKIRLFQKILKEKTHHKLRKHMTGTMAVCFCNFLSKLIMLCK